MSRFIFLLYLFFIGLISASDDGIEMVVSTEQSYCKVLLEKRKKLLYADKENSLLYSSIIANDTDLFEIAVRSATDADLKFKNFRQETLPHIALSRSRFEMFKKLMQKSVGSIDVNAQTYDGHTIAHYAVLHDHVQALNLLHQYQADFDLKDSDGMTPLALAVSLGKDACIDNLLIKRRANVRAKNKYGHESLHFALSERVVNQLMLYGADVNAQGMFRNTPISFAVQKNRPFVVAALLAYKAKLDYVDEFGNNLLHRAPTKNIAQLLVRAGMNVRVCNKKGDLPLHAAAQGKDLELIDYYIAQGCSVSDRNYRQKTPTLCFI